MPDNNNIEIRITTAAELAGAQSVIQSLERQVGAAKASGKAFEEQAEKLDKAKAMVAEYQKVVEAQAEADKKAAAAAAEKAKAIDDANKKEAESQRQLSALAKSWSKGSGIATSDASIAAVKAKADADAAAAKLAAIQQQVNASYANQLFRGSGDVVKKSEDAKKAVENIRQSQTSKVFDELKKSAEAGATAVAASSASMVGSLGKVWTGMRMLTNLLPGLGMAGLIGLIVTGFSKLAEVLFDTSKEVDTLSDKIKNYTEKLNESRVKNAQFARDINAIRNSTKSAAEKLAEYYRIIDSRKSQKERELDATKGLELAHAGKIDDEVQRKTKELEIEKRYGRAKTKLENEAIADKFAADRTEVDRRIQENYDLYQKKFAAEKQLLDAEYLGSTFEDQIKEAKNKVQEAKKQRERTLLPEGHSPESIYRGTQLNDYYARVAKATEALANSEKVVKDLIEAQVRNNIAINNHTTTVNDLNERLRKNESFITEKNSSLQDDINRNKKDADHNNTMQSLDEETRTVRNQTEIDKINRVALNKSSAHQEESLYSGAGSARPTRVGGWTPQDIARARAAIARGKNDIAAKQNFAENSAAVSSNFNQAVFGGIGSDMDVSGGFGGVGDAIRSLTDTMTNKINEQTMMLRRDIKDAENRFKLKSNALAYPNSRLPD